MQGSSCEALQVQTHLPQTVQVNSAGDLGDCPGLLSFLILFAVTAFFRLGCEGFMEVRNQVKVVINSHC